MRPLNSLAVFLFASALALIFVNYLAGSSFDREKCRLQSRNSRLEIKNLKSNFGYTWRTGISQPANSQRTVRLRGAFAVQSEKAGIKWGDVLKATGKTQSNKPDKLRFSFRIFNQNRFFLIGWIRELPVRYQLHGHFRGREGNRLPKLFDISWNREVIRQCTQNGHLLLVAKHYQEDREQELISPIWLGNSKSANSSSDNYFHFAFIFDMAGPSSGSKISISIYDESAGKRVLQNNKVVFKHLGSSYYVLPITFKPERLKDIPLLHLYYLREYRLGGDVRREIKFWARPPIKNE